MDVERNSLKAWILASRPKTLAAAVAPVMVGVALSYHYLGSNIKLIPVMVCFFFAIMMQISANLINDLYDFLKGSDGEDRLGPKRATAQGWITPKAMQIGIAIVVSLACMIGLILVFYTSWKIISVGVFCALFAYFYTSGPFPLAYNGLGDVAVILFFGLVAVGFTCYVQVLEWHNLITFVGLATGLVINTLLVLNNYRDRETDKKSGKRTIIVLFGEPFGRYFYLFSGLIASLSICLYFVIFHNANIFVCVLCTIIYVILHFFTWEKIVKIKEGAGLNKFIGETSRNMLVFSILLSFIIITL